MQVTKQELMNYTGIDSGAGNGTGVNELHSISGAGKRTGVTRQQHSTGTL